MTLKLNLNMLIDPATALSRGEPLFLGVLPDQVRKLAATDAAIAPSDRAAPHSEENPYHAAIYLHAMIKAASQLVDECTDSPKLIRSGVPGLLTVIQERADKLELMLDQINTCGGWKNA